MKPNHEQIGVSAAQVLDLRVSVATCNRVLFPHPQNGSLMMALERKATVTTNGNVSVRAQPFGGAVRMFNSTPLQELIGELRFDSDRSQHEQDFRILIPPSRWEVVKQYCLQHLGDSGDIELEAVPHRELAEEFKEALHADLKPDQYTLQPLGFVIENNPVPTDNADVRGQPTVRLYRTFEVQIIDDALCTTMLATSQLDSDRVLGMLALQDVKNGGRGWANSILALPLDLVARAYLELPPDRRYRKITIENHELDESVLAILEGISVPQYERWSDSSLRRTSPSQ